MLAQESCAASTAETPEQVSFLSWSGLRKRYACPGDLAQLLKEDFSRNLQRVLSYANIDETPQGCVQTRLSGCGVR